MKFEEIDSLNQQLWKNRYLNPAVNHLEAKGVHQRAQKSAYSKGVAYAELNMAMDCFLQSKTLEAFDLVSKSLEFFKVHSEEPGLPRALYLMGNLHESIGDYENGLNHCMQALKLVKESGDREIESETTSVLGLIYTRLCNFTKALEYYQQALDIRNELGDEAAAASSINRIAMIHRLSKEYDTALDYYFQTLTIRQRIGQTDAIPWTYLGIASTYEDLKKYSEAKDYYRMGLLNSDRRCALQCRMGIARIMAKSDHDEDAQKEFLEALSLAEEIKAKPLQAEIHFSLVKHYESVKKPDTALEHFKKYYALREEVLSEETRNRMQKLEITHATETAEKEKEIYRLKHVELKAAFDIIEEKNREIISGISYAQRIQQAILPEMDEVPGLADQCFIIYRPRDIVSGDFYWFKELDGNLIIAAADCTGHGVPGALMSMLGISFLDEIVTREKLLDPSEILSQLRLEVIRALRQTGKEGEQKDGMDISLCVIDRRINMLHFAGAYNSIYVASANDITEYNADHMPIGIYQKSDVPFTKQNIPLNSGDMVYLFSDGMADQFGGPAGKKFKYAALKNLFLEVNNNTLEEQKRIIEARFLEWKGDLEQVDDVMIIGLKC